jgi:hypothetical protein
VKKIITSIFSIILIAVLSGDIYSQPKSTAYLRFPGYLFPGDDYGISDEYPGTVEIVTGVGLNIECGTIFYLTESKQHLLLPGIKATFIDFSIINREIDPSFEIPENDNNIGTVMGQIGLGPVLTLNPGAKILVDVYGQFRMAIGTGDVYSTDVDYEGHRLKVMARGVGGLGVSFNKAFINFEYNYGYKINEFVVNNEVIKEKIPLGYLSLGVGIKFSPFEKDSDNRLDF